MNISVKNCSNFGLKLGLFHKGNLQKESILKITDKELIGHEFPRSGYVLYDFRIFKFFLKPQNM